MIEWFLYSWDKNLHYGENLMTDVPQEKMVYQPAPGMNHPAWLLSHLNAYHPVIAAVIRGEPFDDPKFHRFGMQSQPEPDASVYPSKKELVNAYIHGHERVTEALREAKPARLNEPVPLERWSKTMPNIGTALGYLMIHHEATHLGQLSVWRRVQGMPRV